jgi:manganese transport protein
MTEPTNDSHSLNELHSTVSIPKHYSFWKRLFAFVGPAYLVSVGYMDPGNWATDIEGGSRFGYDLIWVLLISNAMAVLLQTLCARLGIVTGRDLAQACRDSYSPALGFILWVLCEIAIIACDLAEVLGTAIGLNLLLHVPLVIGVLITSVDVLLLLAFQKVGIRRIEASILALIATIGVCFILQLTLCKPDWVGVAAGFIPHLNSQSLFIAIGIIGATVMPHNLYLHSALVQTRAVGKSPEQIAEACKYNMIDSTIALNAAFFVNAAILIVASATFFRNGQIVTDIADAHGLLDPLLGTSFAGAAFAIALLCSGQSSTLTGTLAGQVVMEGFIHFHLRPWVRRIITRSMAIIPAAVTVGILGSEGSYKLLILSQVILSLQLPFAVIPLIHFTNDKRKMGVFANGPVVKVLAWAAAAVIVGLNIWLVYKSMYQWIAGSGEARIWIMIVIVPIIIALFALMAYLAFGPFIRGLRQREEKSQLDFTLTDISPSTFARIGVALETSPGDKRVLAEAITFAREHHSDLMLIHVAEGFGPRYWTRESTDQEVRSDSQYLERLKDEITALNLTADTRLGFGEPADELVRLSKECNLDILFMGSHGHRFPQDILFGATATRVRRNISIPVFIVRIERK